jgi:hypothetical protein
VQLYAMTDWRHGFHFFGRNDIEAWSSDGSRLLRCRSQQLPHDMGAADTLAIGYIPFSEGGQRCVECPRASCFEGMCALFMYHPQLAAAGCRRLRCSRPALCLSSADLVMVQACR